jgi:translation initiation factor IF-2
LLRDNVVVFKGKVGSVRRFKEDVSEVRTGMECGISIANYGDIKVGDVIEVFVIERVAAEAFV